jgi:hypothetical protein
MKGGTSGNREDSLPSMPGPIAQPVNRGGSATGKNPTVYFGGGTSGNREDALPDISVGFDPQPVQDTSGGASRRMPGIEIPYFDPNRQAVGDEHAEMPTTGSPDDNAT